MKKILWIFCAIALIGCSKTPNNQNDETYPLSFIPNVSLSYHPSSETVKLGRDVSNEGAKVSLKSGSSWIQNLKLQGDVVTFNVAVNNNTSVGHRFDTIEVKVGAQRIGTICVTQARKPISHAAMKWCEQNASLYDDIRNLLPNGASGLEITRYIYNLSKTTGGKDDYLAYPAFAYCIEMNHDPEHNLEWYLPAEEEMSRENDRNFDYFGEHLFWTANELKNTTSAFTYRNSTGTYADSKTKNHYVCAFRNGVYEP